MLFAFFRLEYDTTQHLSVLFISQSDSLEQNLMCFEKLL